MIQKKLLDLHEILELTLLQEGAENFGQIEGNGLSTFIKSLVLKPDAKDLALLVDEAKMITRQRFGQVMQFYVPLYLSSFCDSHCVYCGFSSHRELNRVTLSDRELEENLRFLRDQGFDSILLLTGESPSKNPPSYIAKCVERAKKYFSFVGVEIYPMPIHDYETLVNAGGDGVTIYQETYHRKTYSKYHLKGVKKDYLWRLGAPERALTAGFRKVGLGALLGLCDWRFEVSMLAAHAYYLQKKFWKSELTFSFPRINPQGILSRVPFPVSDHDLVYIMAKLRTQFFDIGFILSTREKADLRNQLMDYFITQMSAGSSTSPGGYLKESKAPEEKQFEVVDQRSLDEMVSIVHEKGFDPVQKDWSSIFSKAKHKESQ